MTLWIIFLTGLTVGGLTCLAVQGGLLASVIAAREDEAATNKGKHALYSTGVFLVAKLIAYILLGFILGAFGGALSISDNTQILMQLLAGIYMVVIALNLLDIHPIFRYAVIQPPKFLTRLVRNQSKSRDIFAPALLGAMTVFIPCGTTLAMETLAISSASPIQGSLILAAFVLGTLPAFLGIGFITSVLGETFKSKFLKIAAVAVIYLGVTSIYGAFTAWGITFDFENQAPVTATSVSVEQQKEPYQPDEDKLYSEAPDTQTVEIAIGPNGYSPAYVRVSSGSQVIINLVNRNSYTCASAFRIPSLGIKENLAPGESATITFTPKSKGKIPFTCSMGMYSGVIEVI